MLFGTHESAFKPELGAGSDFIDDELHKDGEETLLTHTLLNDYGTLDHEIIKSLADVDEEGKFFFQ